MAITPAELRRFWRAVLLRDARFDGVFVYAVHSTGIFCRATCPSRRPQRSRITFFRTPAEALQNGFRPCFRCGGATKSGGADVLMVTELCRALEREGASSSRVMEAVAKSAGVSPSRLRRSFERTMGVTPAGYADQARWSRFKRQVREEADVTTAMYGSGYGSSSRLYERSNARLGMTPATYGRGGRGVELHYTIAPSCVGRVLVAGTERGLAAVNLGSTDAELLATLKKEYPHARISRNPAGVSRWVREILRYLAGKPSELDLPLDVQGTAFQRRVWDALRRIPYGETRSYTEIACQLGRAESRRAVARACATNPVALVVPCHRVIRGDGGLGGYAGGIERKQALLATEKRGVKKATKSSMRESER